MENQVAEEEGEHAGNSSREGIDQRVVKRLIIYIRVIDNLFASNHREGTADNG